MHAQEMLNDWELKGHSVSHPFEEERRGHQQTEHKKKTCLIFYLAALKGSQGHRLSGSFSKYRAWVSVYERKSINPFN